MQDSTWIQENYGTYSILVFDTWSDGLEEAWLVHLVQADIDLILDELKSGIRECLSQDLLADYDSEHFDKGTVGYKMLESEVVHGEWVSEKDWLENCL